MERVEIVFRCFEWKQAELTDGPTNRVARDGTMRERYRNMSRKKKILLPKTWEKKFLWWRLNYWNPTGKANCSNHISLPKVTKISPSTAFTKADLSDKNAYSLLFLSSSAGLSKTIEWQERERCTKVNDVLAALCHRIPPMRWLKKKIDIFLVGTHTAI